MGTTMEINCFYVGFFQEMMQSNMGVIHVIKDEAQILPYCILHLTRGQHENAFQAPVQQPPFPPHQFSSVVNPAFYNQLAMFPRIPPSGMGPVYGSLGTTGPSGPNGLS